MNSKHSNSRAPSQALRGMARSLFGVGLLAAASLAGAAPVTATFSHDFGGGNLFTGSLSGELHDAGTASTLDDYIDGISGLTASFNGVALRGSLFLSAYDGGGRRDDLPGRLYTTVGSPAFNPGFIIVNCASASACQAALDAGDYNYFLLRHGGTPEVNFFDRLTGQADRNFAGAINGWQLSVTPVVDTVEAVPEPATLFLAALGLAGLARSRRKA